MPERAHAALLQAIASSGHRRGGRERGGEPAGTSVLVRSEREEKRPLATKEAVQIWQKEEQDQPQAGDDQPKHEQNRIRIEFVKTTIETDLEGKVVDGI